jgi:hypothetical protein
LFKGKALDVAGILRLGRQDGSGQQGRTHDDWQPH